MAFNLTRILGTVKSEKNMSDVVTLHSGTNTVKDSVTFDAAKYNTLYLRATGYYYTFIVKVSKDGTTWTRVPAYNLYNNKKVQEIRVNGQYAVDVTGYRYVNCPTINGCMELTLDAWASYESLNINENTRRPAFSRPFPAQPVATEKQNTYFGFCQDIYYNKSADTNVVYGYAGPSIFKSSKLGGNIDNGAALKTFSKCTINVIKKLDTGKILVGLHNTETDYAEIWLSDDKEETWTKVLDGSNASLGTPTPGNYFAMWFGHSFYRNICLLAEYGKHNDARRVFMSTDYGETWKTVFTANQAPLTDGNAGTHIHDVTYDPYSNIIWICTGDGVHSHNVYWSKNMGKTWNAILKSSKTAPSQFTQIIPLPNCILLVSDNAQHAGVFRINREVLNNGTISLADIEPAFFLEAAYNAESPIAVQYGIDYKTGAVYFGWCERGDVAKMIPSVIATANGYDFFTVWRGNKVPEGSTGYYGVTHISGASANGKIAVSLYTDDNYVSNKYHTVTFDAPSWSAIGKLEEAVDGIIAIQNTLIGGDA
jgi:hypothetical protein